MTGLIIITKNSIPIGFVEAKVIGKNLDDRLYKEQFDRYKGALENLIITDYLEFRLFRLGVSTSSFTIGKVEGDKVIAKYEDFERFSNLVRSLFSGDGIGIQTPEKLAAIMAAKARVLADVIRLALISDIESEANTTLKDQMAAFKTILLNDITEGAFADIYAQTITYGMFAARVHDKTLGSFTRQEASELIPKSNPFLRKLFQYISGIDVDDRILWIVDSLADVFRAADVKSLLRNFGKKTKQEDPIVHFYETFLSEYDPQLRKMRGVWYTPEPVVKFIVRSVDEIMQSYFHFGDGLADYSKTNISIKMQGKKVKESVHRVQILDPATGTGTFLSEVIRTIRKKFDGVEGAWDAYVVKDLIPRLNGFEVLMASYAMAHLKLDLMLAETGFTSSELKQRFRVFLTNSLEEAHPDTGTLFASWLSQEASEANAVKGEAPVMVVLGNPPYSGISSNNGEWISKLIEDYKYVDEEHFGEKKHWLHDDYVKFIRFGEYLIERNGDGVLAYINNNSFLDNPTFRGMRWHLLTTFDAIFIVDLHGNSKKKEVARDGSKDENVFDIQQGVSINIFVKTGKKKKNKLASLYYHEIYGDRDSKYKILEENSLESLSWTELRPEKPYYFFNGKEFSGNDSNVSFSIESLFKINISGIVTARDSLVIDFNKESLINKISDFADPTQTDDDTRAKYFGISSDQDKSKYLPGDSRGWSLPIARKKIRNNRHAEIVKDILYRPFDRRAIYYSSDMVDWAREKLMANMLAGSNIALIVPKQLSESEEPGAFITDLIGAHKTCSAYNINYYFPLFLYSREGEMALSPTKSPNFNRNVIDQIEIQSKLRYDEVSGDGKNTFCPIDLLDYIYATLYSDKFRKENKEDLKVTFPNIPYPKSGNNFSEWQGLDPNLEVFT